MKRIRWALTVAALAGVCVVAAPAYAETVDYYYVNTRTVCAASTDTSVVCSSDLAYHAFCGCMPRVAYSRSTYDNPVPQGRARAVW